jgi:hypothetical protein
VQCRLAQLQRHVLETNLNTSVTNCGDCGKVCTVPNGTPACTKGVCTIWTCNVGWRDCNGDKTDGCETNLDTSVANCGMCGNACSATQTCVNGLCT